MSREPDNEVAVFGVVADADVDVDEVGVDVVVVSEIAVEVMTAVDSGKAVDVDVIAGAAADVQGTAASIVCYGRKTMVEWQLSIYVEWYM